MKLYIYDHCPFCVRSRMIFGLRQVPIQLEYLLNNDEATPIGMIGAKQVPILQKNDQSYMGESLDIVRYINDNTGHSPIDEILRPAIQVWFDGFSAYGNHLIMPRDIQLNLPEFATQSAIDYFVNKKQEIIGDFTQNLANSAEYINQANIALKQLDKLLSHDSAYLNGQNLSMEDIVIFPLLRNLSMVKGLIYPNKVRIYTENMAQMSQINLYFEQAI